MKNDKWLYMDVNWPESALAFHCTEVTWQCVEKKRLLWLSVQSPMILLIYGLEGGLKYMDLIVEALERLPRILHIKKIFQTFQK